jgi:hypothetical protein
LYSGYLLLKDEKITFGKLKQIVLSKGIC